MKKQKGYFVMVKTYLTRFRKIFYKTEQEYVEEYLAKSKDHQDLEWRMKHLRYRGYFV